MGRKAASTGPRTVAGKERSSRNALRHGCTSKRLLLEGDDPAEWEALQAQWVADYEPDKPTFRDQVLRAAEAEWLLRRAVDRYYAAEHELCRQEPELLEWTDEQHKMLERFGRYRTTAQRWFHRERGAAEQLRKARFSEGLRLEAARRRAVDFAASEPEDVAEVVETIAEKPVYVGPIPAIVQDIEVNVDAEGRTVSTWWPPHEYVKTRARLEQEPVYVRRHFYFFCAVPPEYYWLTDDPAEREPKSEFSRTMPYAEWLKWIELEERVGSEHLLGE